MYNVHYFIFWALTHTNEGSEPWHYLFGSVRVRTDKATLDRYFENHYKAQMTRERYDALTADWKPTDYATDCQGLLDAWLTHVIGVATDINADMNYRLWCTDKGRIGEITRQWMIGEAVFRMNDAGRMTHVGWICGFREDGEPLVVEARGIAYGVVVTRLSKRDFTHRGLMTAKFDYSAADNKPQEEIPMEKIKFESVSPMHKGDAFRLMQQALNAAGYTDADGAQLDEDGKWGRKSQQAFDALIQDYAESVIPAPEIPDEPDADEGIEIKPIMHYTKGDHGEYTVLVFNTADLPEGLL